MSKDSINKQEIPNIHDWQPRLSAHVSGFYVAAIRIENFWIFQILNELLF